MSDKFTNNLCITNALFIIIELDRPEILINPRKRKKLLDRIRKLAVITLFLPQYYKHTGQASLDWLEEHFKNMSFHILERGRWAITPTELTLGDLRGDFYELAGMYITGRYGEFKSPSMPSTSKSKSTWKTQLLITVSQLLSVAIPVILLIPSVYKNIFDHSVDPKTVTFHGVDPKTVTLILISWLLISVDSILKLGIMKNFIDLWKGIKDSK